MAATSFWGLQLARGLRFSKTADSAFHISAATLDPNSIAEDTIVSVVYEDEDKEFILCNLSKKHSLLQVPLDLQFSEGEAISFSLRGGKGNVFLTGYNIYNEDMEFEDESDLEGYEEEDSPVARNKRKRDMIEEKKSPKNSAKKVKTENSLKNAQKDPETPDSTKKANRKKRQRERVEALRQKNDVNTSVSSPTTKGSAEKKGKKIKSNAVVNSLSALLTNGDMGEDDEDDEDFTMEDAEVESDAEVEEEESDGDDEEEEDEEEQEDEEDDEDDDDEDEEEDEEEEVESPKKSIQTPTGKAKQNKNKAPTPTSGQKTPKSQNSLETPKSQKKNKENVKTPVSGKKKDAQTPQSEGKKQVKAGGVICEDVQIGTGPEAKSGKMCAVYYEGKLKNGKAFDKTISGPPFRFRLGSNEVIKAWDIGVQGMRVGGKRRLTAPPTMAYGKKGAPPSIPSNSVLVFDVELKSVN